MNHHKAIKGLTVLLIVLIVAAGVVLYTLYGTYKAIKDNPMAAFATPQDVYKRQILCSGTVRISRCLKRNGATGKENAQGVKNIFRCMKWRTLRGLSLIHI